MKPPTIDCSHETELRLNRSWIELYCRGDWARSIRFQKEEQGIPHPDWMLPDGNLDPELQA